ncbi:MAG: serine protease [Planctomycetota bacterium]|nr:serine protease [Planctomycetota bacterium]
MRVANVNKFGRMARRSRGHLVAMLSVIASCAALAAPGVAQAQGPAGGASAGSHAAEYKALIEKHAGAIVSVRFVMSFAPEYEPEMETNGVMVDPSGLVLVSNTLMGGFASQAAARMGRPAPTPKELKVILEDEPEGVEARLVARDTELDLAWVQIKEPGDRKFASLDLAASATPSIGDRTLSVWRMGKFFDRAPTVTENRIMGEAKKPRPLYVGFGASYGAPVFTANGQFIGVGVLQQPDSEEEQMDAGDRAFMILPAAQVASATKKAQEAAKSGKDLSAEEAAAAEEAAGDQEQPAPEEPAEEPAPAPGQPK